MIHLHIYDKLLVDEGITLSHPTPVYQCLTYMYQYYHLICQPPIYSVNHVNISGTHYDESPCVNPKI